MSIVAHLDSIPYELREQISKELEIKLESNTSNFQANRFLYPYDVIDNGGTGDIIYLPFAYACAKIKLSRPKRDTFPQMNTPFAGTLRKEQLELRSEAISHLNTKGSVVISGYCGFGKTCCSIEIASATKLKTLILVNKVILMNQWEESIKKFCPSAVVQLIKPKNTINKDADFCIINAQNIEKFGRNAFSHIGTCIVDECHLIMAERLSKCMQYIIPRYLIGLSATPFRPDGLNVLLDLYFGRQKVIRNLYRKHTVYKVDTKFKPVVKKVPTTGKLDWNAVLESQATNMDRNELIIKIIQKFQDRTFLVLVKRISQGEYLLERLKEVGVSVTSLLGSQQEFDTEARVLIGTNSKIGTGFDHCKLNTLLLAADVEEYYIQYMGRVFRTKEGEPIIFDLVDKNPILEKHFNTRRNVYNNAGGVVKTLTEEQVDNI